jgi:hypothetical protein
MIEVVRTIANEEHFILSRLWRDPSEVNEVFEVRISPLVDCFNDGMTPVYDYLSTVCAVKFLEETERDSDWAWGEYQLTLYSVFPVCPGGFVDHLCLHARTEDASKRG